MRQERVQQRTAVELGVLAKRQLQLDTVRADERDVFAKAKADFEQGISGVQKAVETCGTTTEFHSPRPAACCTRGPRRVQTGAGSSITGRLEVIESDFSKNLAELSLAEDEAESGFLLVTQAISDVTLPVVTTTGC